MDHNRSQIVVCSFLLWHRWFGGILCCGLIVCCEVLGIVSWRSVSVGVLSSSMCIVMMVSVVVVSSWAFVWVLYWW